MGRHAAGKHTAQGAVDRLALEVAKRQQRARDEQVKAQRLAEQRLAQAAKHKR